MLFNEERGSRKTNSDGLLPLLREREREKNSSKKRIRYSLPTMSRDRSERIEENQQGEKKKKHREIFLSILLGFFLIKTL